MIFCQCVAELAADCRAVGDARVISKGQDAQQGVLRQAEAAGPRDAPFACRRAVSRVSARRLRAASLRPAVLSWAPIWSSRRRVSERLGERVAASARF